MRTLPFPAPSYISLPDLREHLRIASIDASDFYLTTLLEASLLQISEDLGRTLYPATETPDLVADANAIKIVAQLVIASMLLVGHWFEHRESVTEISQSITPHGYNMIVERLRINQTGFLEQSGGE